MSVAPHRFSNNICDQWLPLTMQGSMMKSYLCHLYKLCALLSLKVHTSHWKPAKEQVFISLNELYTAPIEDASVSLFGYSAKHNLINRAYHCAKRGAVLHRKYHPIQKIPYLLLSISSLSYVRCFSNIRSNNWILSRYASLINNRMGMLI